MFWVVSLLILYRKLTVQSHRYGALGAVDTFDPLCKAIRMLPALQTLEGMGVAPSIKLGRHFKDHPSLTRAVFQEYPCFYYSTVPAFLIDRPLTKIWLESLAIRDSGFAIQDSLLEWVVSDLRGWLNMGMRVGSLDMDLGQTVGPALTLLSDSATLFAPGMLENISVKVYQEKSWGVSTLQEVLSFLEHKLRRPPGSSAALFPDVQFTWEWWDDQYIPLLPLYPAAIDSNLIPMSYSIGLRSAAMPLNRPSAMVWPKACCIVQVFLIIKRNYPLKSSRPLSSITPYLEDLTIETDNKHEGPIINSNLIVRAPTDKCLPETH
jgi:hypothetical protein